MPSRASPSRPTRSATDLRLLQHDGEIEEPFETTQVGSSAMPYKRNPMRAERICALARHVIALSIDTAMTAATQWLERTLDDSANKRIAVPEAFLDHGRDPRARSRTSSAASSCIPRSSRRRLDAEIPFLATENVMMEAVRRGGDRQELHERLRVHARASADLRASSGAPADLFDRIAADSAFGLTRAALEDVGRPETLVGRSAAAGRGVRPGGARSGARGSDGGGERARPRLRRAPPFRRLPAFSCCLDVACASRAASRPVSKPDPARARRISGWTRGRPRVLVRRRRRLRGQAHRLRRDLRLLEDDRRAPRPAARHGRARDQPRQREDRRRAHQRPRPVHPRARHRPLAGGRPAPRPHRPGRRSGAHRDPLAGRRARRRCRPRWPRALGRAGRIFGEPDRADAPRRASPRRRLRRSTSSRTKV